ncbi:MAG: LysR family transcriptional regulator [Candidatus Protistobacter heckmanni]|nr:LysR family transcriptional regulator [Candidatus Protistobacter heckmanni]
MDLNGLRILVRIIDTGSLSAAARSLKTTRSNISYHLRTLEASVGAQLLRRTTRNVEPTHIGAGVYEHGKNILRELDAATAFVSSAGRSLQGAVRISVPTGLGNVVFSELLLEFRRQNPGVAIDVVFDNRVSNLVAERVDIAVRIISAPTESLVATKLADIEWVVCATRAFLEAQGRPTELRQLADFPVVCSAAVGQKLKIAGARGQKAESVHVEPVVRSDNSPFLYEATLAGLGVGVLPRFILNEALAAGLLVPLLEDYRISVFGSKIFMLAMPSRYQAAATKALAQFIKARFPARWAEAVGGKE